MMFKTLRLAGFAAAAVFAVAAADADAATVSLVAASTQGAGNTANVFGAGFDATTPAGAVWSDDAPVVTPAPGNLAGVYQSPFNNTPLLNTQSYFSIGAEDGDGDGGPSPITLTFGVAQSSFSLLWGSIDSYNRIEFFDENGASVLARTGSDVISEFNLGGSASNFEQVALLDFGFDQGEAFKSIVFTSTRPAFEFALAASAVPLPAAGWLMLAGVGALAAAGRRRRQAAQLDRP